MNEWILGLITIWHSIEYVQFFLSKITPPYSTLSKLYNLCSHFKKQYTIVFFVVYKVSLEKVKNAVYFRTSITQFAKTIKMSYYVRRITFVPSVTYY